MITECDRVRLVYIVGSGRSGSTLLDTLLGSHKEVFGAGELYNLAKWVREDRVCTCGEPIGNCRFWSKVLTVINENNCASSGLLGESRRRGVLTGIRLISSVLTGRPPITSEFQRKCESVLLRELSQRAGSLVVVDSSKEVRRLVELTSIPGIDLRVIHLIRDGRGYAYSKKKHRVMQTPVGTDESREAAMWSSVMCWAKTNILAAIVIRCLLPNRYIVVSYEKLADTPDTEMRRIFTFLGIENDSSKLEISQEEERHNVAGNNTKFAGFLKIQKDDGWRTGLSHREKLLFGVTFGWLNWIFNRMAR